MPKLTLNDIPNDVKDKIVAAYLEYTTDWVSNSERLDGSYEVVDFEKYSYDSEWVAENGLFGALGTRRLIVKNNVSN